jgi:glycosyltransferase involved in cell wall biosynthesis
MEEARKANTGAILCEAGSVMSHNPCMTTPEISVVMSVYNGARYLRDAIDSILQQEGVSLEFIIVNDGSIDESGRILEEYAARDSRVIVIEQQNAGLTASLIQGCRLARGEFIARQDADDLSLPGRLAKQRDVLRVNKDVVFVSSWAQGVGPEAEWLEVVQRPDDSLTATQQLLFAKTGPPAHGTVMMRRAAYDAVGGYRDEFYFAQDSDLWLRLGRIGRIQYFPEILYAWRVSPTGISTSRQAQQLRFGDLGQECHAAIQRGASETEFLKRAADLAMAIRLKKHSPMHLCARTKAWGLYRIGTTLVRQGDSRARDYFWQTIQTQPWHVRAWIRLFQSFLLKRSHTSMGDSSG